LELLSASVDGSFVNNPNGPFAHSLVQTLLRIENAEAVNLDFISNYNENGAIIMPGTKLVVKDAITIQRFGTICTYMTVATDQPQIRPPEQMDLQALQIAR